MSGTTASGLRFALARGLWGWPSRGLHRHVLRYRELSLDPRSRVVRRGRRPIELTPTEFELLALFLRHPGEVLTRRQIFEDVWGFDFGRRSNLLPVYVGYLRRKLELDGRPRLLHTVRGVGYVLHE